VRKRPLCYLCLAFLLLKAVLGLVGGAKLEREFRPAPVEKSGLKGEQVLAEGRVYKKEEKEKYQLIYLKNNSIVHSGQQIKESRILIYDEKLEISCVSRANLDYLKVPLIRGISISIFIIRSRKSMHRCGHQRSGFWIPKYMQYRRNSIRSGITGK